MTTAQRAGSQIAENLRLSLSTALHSTAIIIRAIGAVPQWQPSGEGGDQGAFLGVMPSSPRCLAALGLCAPVLPGTGPIVGEAQNPIERVRGLAC